MKDAAYLRNGTAPNEVHGRNLSQYRGTVASLPQPLHWAEQGDGEILFSRDGAPATSFERLGLTPDEQLRVMNKLLAHYRAHAIGCENHYLAAAAGVTSEGRLFIETNNMLHIKDKFYRGCAETPMLRKAQNARGSDDVKLPRVFLMSGIAEKLPGTGLKEKEPHHIGCPCGECRVNLRNATEGGTFIMLPVNDGSLPLTLKRAAHSSELKRGEAWEIPHEQMYPLPVYQTLPPESAKIVKDGYEYVTNTHTEALPPVTPLADITPNKDGAVTISMADFMRMRRAYEHQGLSLHALNDHPTLENINRVMLQLVKKAYEDHIDKISDTNNIDISVIIVKTNKGEFFPGVLVNGEKWLPNKPADMPVALANAMNHIGIAEVYMMNFNDRELREEMATAHDTKQGHRLKMPDPAALGRVIKNMKPSDTPHMHVLPVNDGTLKEAQLQALDVEFDIREEFGPGYSNPKHTLKTVH